MKHIISLYHWLARFKNTYRAIGLVGFIVYAVAYAVYPSFPTPDKILLFIILGAMIFSQAIAFTFRFVPFIAILYAYEAFRGLAHHLNTHVNYLWMPDVDRLVFFGHLPTRWLQDHFWNGSVQWYDFVFYIAYMAHFVVPLLLAVVIWKKFPTHYWRFVATYGVLSFAGFLTYLLFPAAPPWMASDYGLIEPIHRVSSDVWYALGVNDFSTFYSQVSPNPVAAVPSLHSAYALMFALFVVTLFKTKWKHVAWVFPLLMIVGTVYQGEHYVIDALIGWLYTVVAFYGCKKIAPRVATYLQSLKKKLISRTA